MVAVNCSHPDLMRERETRERQVEQEDLKTVGFVREGRLVGKFQGDEKITETPNNRKKATPLPPKANLGKLKFI